MICYTEINILYMEGSIIKMNKKWKILIVHNQYQIAGGEDTVVSNEKALLEKYGNDVFFYCRNNTDLQSISILRKIFIPFIAVFNIKTYYEIIHLIRKEKIDIIHVHNTLLFISPSVYYAAKKCKVPVIQTIHNFRLLCPNAVFYRDNHICEDCLKKGLICSIKHKCYRNSRIQTLACVISLKIHYITGIYKRINYICLTEFNKKKLLNLKQIAADSIFIKPNFSEKTSENIIYGSRKNQYIFAGRIEKLKGIDKLLIAWKNLEYQRGSDTPELIVCGTGPLEEQCKSYIFKNGISHINMYGNISHRELQKIIAVSKALILPTQLYEGFPMVIVESYSNGTPVIGSDIGNTATLIHTGKTGEKFIHDHPESIIDAINRFESGNLEMYQKHSYDFYLNNFTPEINYKQFMEIYKKITLKELKYNEIRRNI